MEHTLVQSLAPRASRRERSCTVEDPLAAARGIAAGVLLSVLGFWLPLVLLLAH